MAQFHPAWLEHQRKRWRRHDWQRYVRPDAGSDAKRYFRPQYAHLEPEPVVRKDAAVRADMTPEELAAYRAELLELKALAAELKWQFALRRVDEGGAADVGHAARESVSTDISSVKRSSGGIAKKFWGWTVRQFVSQHCTGRINRELPGEFENVTIADLLELRKGGSAAADKCYKLLNEPRFRK